VAPWPDQQADTAAGCPQRIVVGEHPAEEEVIPAALQVHHRRHPVAVATVISGLPIGVVRAVMDPLLKPAHPMSGQRHVRLYDGQCGHRAPHQLGTGEQAKELARRSTFSTKHAIDDLHPAQGVAQRESAAWIHELLGKL
jgi:hypothetical protein